MESVVNFLEKVKDLTSRSKQATQLALTEEATKTSVIMPFIQALGFDVFNLSEVVPEFVADVGIKKGEKIDFAVKIGGKISILIEAKPITTSLSTAHFSQLFRYFGTLEVRLAILTNGREIWFFSDIDEKNRMDKKPFFVFDLQSHDETKIEHLARFQKIGFDIDTIVDAATNLKLITKVVSYLSGQITKPDDDFIRLVAKQTFEGSITKNVIEQLRPTIPAAFEDVLKTRMQDKLGIVFRSETTTEAPPAPVADIEIMEIAETTDEEMQAFYIVRAIGARIVPVSRITMRDAKSYCSIFVDDKNNRPVCRLYFNAKSVKRIGIFDIEKNETKHDIKDVSEIYTHSVQIEEAIASYLTK